MLSVNNKKRNNDNNVTASNKKARKRRSTKRYPIMCQADDRSLREAVFEDSTWFRSCVQQPLVGKRLLKKIRQRFRITYSLFFSSCDEIKYHKLFDRWNTSDTVGKKASGIRLLLLGTLRHLGRERTFDDANEST